jgi:ankyrin repeat protein
MSPGELAFYKQAIKAIEEKKVNEPINHRTCLFRAVSYGQKWADVVEGLLEAGADPALSRRGKKEQRFGPIHWAIKDGNIGVTKKLLKYCEDNISTLTDALGQTPLHYAAKVGQVELFPLLKEAINSQDKYGRTPLHCVLIESDLDLDLKEKVVTALIALGAELTISDKEGLNCYDYAGDMAEVIALAITERDKDLIPDSGKFVQMVSSVDVSGEVRIAR